MSRAVSPSTNKPYGVLRVVSVWNLARSGFYAARARIANPREPVRRGPKVLSDDELLAAIRKQLEEPHFTGEGYRKVWAVCALRGPEPQRREGWPGSSRKRANCLSAAR
jgi:putative transposase